MSVKLGSSLLPGLCMSEQFVELFNWSEEFYVEHQDRNIRARVWRRRIQLSVMSVYKSLI